MADWTHYKIENSGNGRYRYRIENVTTYLEKESDAFPVFPRIKNLQYLIDKDKSYLYFNISNISLDNDYGLSSFNNLLKPLIEGENADCVLFDFSYDPFENHKIFLDNWNVKSEFIVLVNDYNYIFNKTPNYVYHNPFIWQYKQGLYKSYENDKKYLISCINGVPRLERIQLFKKLKILKNFDKILFSIGSFGSKNDLDYSKMCIGPIDQEEIKDFYLKFKNGFKNFYLEAPIYNVGSDHSVLHPAFKKSCINVITETAPNQANFFTEKTWKPIFAKQFFLTLNKPYAIKTLRECGFDVFDDIIDHSYDLEENYEKRLELLVYEIDRLLDQDQHIFDKHIECRERLQHNFNLLTSEDFLK